MATPIKDSNYEFSAPSFVDFGDEAIHKLTDGADEWFEGRKTSLHRKLSIEALEALAASPARPAGCKPTPDSPPAQDEEAEPMVAVGSGGQPPRKRPSASSHGSTASHSEISEPTLVDETESTPDAASPNKALAELQITPPEPNQVPSSELVTPVCEVISSEQAPLANLRAVPFGGQPRSAIPVPKTPVTKKTAPTKKVGRKSAPALMTGSSIPTFMRPTASVAARAAAANAKSGKTPAKRASVGGVLTIPKSPAFTAPARPKSRILSSEEKELLEIEEKRAALASRRAKSRRAKSLALNPSRNYMPVRSERPLTEPVDVVFRSDSRVGRRAPVQDTRPASARPAQRSRSAEPMRLTVPKPFSFASDKAPLSARSSSSSTSSQAPGSPYVPVAEAISKMQKRTPNRFRSKVGARPASAPSGATRSLTVATSPQFATITRSRPSHVMTTAEREAAELASIRAKPFKARPVDRHVMDSAGQLGVPKVAKPALTKPRSPKFASNDRLRATFGRSSTSAIAGGRRSRSVNLDDSFSSTGSARSARSASSTSSRRSLTTPRSPKLHTKARARPSTAPSSVEAELMTPRSAFRARPVPASNRVAPKAPASKKPLTQPAPFNLATENRGTEKVYELFEKVKAEREQENAAREFVAAPIRHNRPSSAPMGYRPKPLTRPEPFALESLVRHNEAVEKFNERVSSELDAEENFKAFAAAPVPKAIYSPFMPSKSTAPLTEIQDFTLNSTERQEMRSKWETARMERDAAAEAARRERERLMAEEEAAAIKAIRKAAEFKAAPVRSYKPISRSSAADAPPLTDPRSPNLATASRARQ